MAELRTIGLKSIKVGDIAGDGGMGTTLAELGVTFEGTATLSQDDPEVTNFFAEEVDDPIDTLSKKGTSKIEWAITDFTPATMEKVLGGTVTGTGDAAVWGAPAGIPEIEQSLEIITKKNVKFQVPRAKIEAKLDVNFSKKEMGLIRIVATILEPTKDGVSPLMVSKEV